MGGLLDFIKTPEGMGLISAVAGGLSGAKRGTPFNNIGRGLLAGMSGYGSGLEMQKAAQEQARQQAEREAMQNAYKALLGQPDVLQPAMQQPATAQPINYSVAQPQASTPMPRNTAAMPTPQVAQNPYLKMAADGIPLDKIKLIYETANIGRPKIKNIETISINGQPTKVGIDEYGTQVAQIGTEWRPLQVQDFGGYLGGIDVTNPNAPVKNYGQKTLPPGEAQRLAIEQQRLQLAKQAQAFDQGLTPDQGMPMAGGMSVNPPQISGGAALPGGPLPAGMLGGGQPQAINAQQVPNQVLLSKRLGKPPAGFRWTVDGNLEPVPGGPGDQKAQAVDSGRENVSKIVAELRNSYDVLDKNNAIPSVNNRALTSLGAWSSASPVGQKIGGMFGTQSQKERDSIAQARPLLMQAIMKATGMSSKQMDSNAELKMYLATATDPTLSLEANKAALDRLESMFGLSGAMPQQTQNRSMQQMQPRQQATSMPMKGQVVDGYKFNGGNPADPKNWSKQ